MKIILGLIFIINLSLCDYERFFCHDIPFCNRNMFWEDQAPVYYIDFSKIKVDHENSIINAKLINANKEYLTNAKDLDVNIYVLKYGMFRVVINDENTKRFKLTEEDSPFNVVGLKKNLKNVKISQSEKAFVLYYYSKNSNTKYELTINYQPFKITYRSDKNIIFIINSRNLFDMEFPSQDFKITEKDSMSSIKLDVLFPESYLFTGLPERYSGSLSLSDTLDDEYYHFYNIDMFKYQKLPYSGLYGVIPFIMSHSHGGQITSGFIWNNPSETFIGIKTFPEGKNVLWLSESGIFDFAFFSDGQIGKFYKKFMKLIGPAAMPPQYAFGHHQSRYAYKTLDMIKEIDNKFDEYDIPYESIWFDIDHTDGKRYFTWDKNFKGVEEFLEDYITNKGRQPTLIIDPHIKVDKWYFLYYEASSKGYLIKNEGKEFVGKCWCGNAAYLDFFDKRVQQYWTALINNTESYFFNLKLKNVWNDMNEPSVFEIDRNTVPKTAIINYNNSQHELREAHNIYGLFMHRTTYDALVEKYGERPFVLTRAFYLGSHRTAATWTGDIVSSFESLEGTLSTLLSLSISGYSFIGTDIGGFADNGEPELYVRWYQNGIFYPFFRSHSHEHSYRREPWLFEEKVFENIKASIITRYQLLNYIYTQFAKHRFTGMPLMIPIYFKYQNEFTLDNKYLNTEYFFGDYLLIRPVLTKDEHFDNKVSVYLNEDERWFDYYTHEEILNKGKIEYAVSYDHCGVFYKGGSVILKKMRPRRSSKMMIKDPFTIYIIVGKNNTAEGEMYFDDNTSFDFENGLYSYGIVEFKSNEVSYHWTHSQYTVDVGVEKVVVLGIKNKVNSVSIDGVECDFTQTDKEITVYKIEKKFRIYTQDTGNSRKNKILFNF